MAHVSVVRLPALHDSDIHVRRQVREQTRLPRGRTPEQSCASIASSLQY